MVGSKIEIQKWILSFFYDALPPPLKSLAMQETRVV